MIFQTGDRVRLVRGTYRHLHGMVGTVVTSAVGVTIGVEFDDWHEGHNLNGYLPSTNRSGWFLSKDDLEPEVRIRKKTGFGMFINRVENSLTAG